MNTTKGKENKKMTDYEIREALEWGLSSKEILEMLGEDED